MERLSSRARARVDDELSRPRMDKKRKKLTAFVLNLEPPHSKRAKRMNINTLLENKTHRRER